MSSNARVQRLDFVDGLRAVAVLLVVVSHAWTPPHAFILIWAHNRMVAASGTSLDTAVSRGYQGVSLFLVLSGFCLAYPALRRRAAGEQQWFSASTFFARRCLRILPPYYAALALSVAAVLVWRHTGRAPLPAFGTLDLTPGNLLTHLFLIHNFSPYVYSINSPFWSLALEWQWYWVFPLVLALSARFPRVTPMCLLVIAALWQGWLHDIPALMSWLPGRIFEFSAGVAVAQCFVRKTLPHPAVSVCAAVAAVFLAEGPFGTILGDVGLYQPLYGVAGAALLLAACRPGPMQRVLSARWLVRLGVMSYSVYLVHRIPIDIIIALSPRWMLVSYLNVPIGIACGFVAGYAFHHAVERPCLHPSTWERVSRWMLPVCSWTDRLYRGFKPALRGPSEAVS